MSKALQRMKRRITELLVKGGAHTCFADAWIFDTPTKCVWAPPFVEV